MGVQRAVEIALKASEKAKPAQAGLFTIGPLIHNRRILEKLEKRGIVCLEENEMDIWPTVQLSTQTDKAQQPSAEPATLQQAMLLPENSTVIIRAHGISPLVEKAIFQQGASVLDATCPRVKQSQSKVRNFAEKGYVVFLAGEEKHSEIAGITGYAENFSRLPFDLRCFVVGNPDAAEAASREIFHGGAFDAKTVLIGQTTIREEEYKAIAERIRQFFPSLEIVDSICGATRDRQRALKELCKKVDAVIIAGGHESANTQRLFSLAQESGKPAWLVESVAELPPEIRAFQTVGLSAGASTPDELINEIEEALTNPNLPG